jgi:hypothetical protein
MELRLLLLRLALPINFIGWLIAASVARNGSNRAHPLALLHLLPK